MSPSHDVISANRDAAGTLCIVAAPTTAAVRTESDRICAELVSSGTRVARLLPDSRMATLTKQRLADAGQLPLGEHITTLSAWLRDRWALFGDGRQLVSASQRRALVIQALEQTKVERIDSQAPGMPRCVEDTLRTYAGTPAICPESAAAVNGLARANESAMSASQLDMLNICRTYQHLLDANRLIEPGRAAVLLPAMMDDVGWSHLVLDGISELGQAQASLMVAGAKHAGATVVVRADPAPVRPSDALHADQPASGTVSSGTSASDPLADSPEQGEHPGLALARPLIETFAQLCQASGVACEISPAASDPCPWKSQEIRSLAETLFRPAPERMVISTGDVRFALPAGRYAEPQAIVNEIAGMVARGIEPRDIVVVCSKPLAMAKKLRGRLLSQGAHGIGCEANGTVEALLTGTGRTLFDLVELTRQARATSPLSPAPALRPIASDLARYPGLGIPTMTACKLDASWRERREASAQDFLDDLAQRSPHARDALKRLKDDDLVGALDAIAPPSDALEQRAFDAIRMRLVQAQDLGSDVIAQFDQLMDGLMIPASSLTIPPGSLDAQASARVLQSNPNVVRIVGARDIEGMHARAVIICDLEAAGQTDPIDALGITGVISDVDRQRWRFSAAIEAASELVVLERCLSDENTDPLRPSSLFEETVECYRRDITDVDGLDKLTCLPKASTVDAEDQQSTSGATDQLLPQSSVGEEDIPTVVSPIGAALEDRAQLTVDEPALVLRQEESREALADPGRPLSPSSIEAYLRCPARWFFERRLPANSLDSAFDPLAIGSFCHAVLKRFYERLPEETTVARLTRDLRASEKLSWPIDQLLDECFEDELALNRDPENSIQNRLVAISEIERHQLRSVRKGLHKRIWSDANIPEDFTPKLLEWSFGLPGSPLGAIEYAGALLCGQIDRVDTNGSGEAIIIDYKGSLDDGHRLPKGYDEPDRDDDGKTDGKTSGNSAHGAARGTAGAADATQTSDAVRAHEQCGCAPNQADEQSLLPLHSQILMYATALARADTGLHSIGAIYLSYRHPEARGFVDARLGADLAGTMLGAADVVSDPRPFMADPSQPGEADAFNQLLAFTERTAAEAIGDLFDGCISPRPRFGEKSCRLCPVASCPERVMI
jgi:ATP-dependent helicase/nuclease subunit B